MKLESIRSRAYQRQGFGGIITLYPIGPVTHICPDPTWHYTETTLRRETMNAHGDYLWVGKWLEIKVEDLAPRHDDAKRAYRFTLMHLLFIDDHFEADLAVEVYGKERFHVSMTGHKDEFPALRELTEVKE